MPDFLGPETVDEIRDSGEGNRKLAYYTASNHNIYLAPPDANYPPSHPRNREVVSTKGCITTDQIPLSSPLQVLYDAPEFRQFLCAVLGEHALYE